MNDRELSVGLAALAICFVLAGGCQESDSGPLRLTPASPPVMDVDGGNSPGAAVTFTLRNEAASTLGLLTAPVLGGDDPDHFELVDDDCRGLALLMGQSCTFRIRPVASGNGMYQVKLAGGDGNISSNVVTLGGEARGFSASAIALAGPNGVSLTALDITGGASQGAAVTLTARNMLDTVTGALQARRSAKQIPKTSSC